MKIRLRYVIIALLMLPIAWHLLPLLERHPEQDQCTFGTGSTQLYKKMRAEADTYLAEHGKVRLGGYYGDNEAGRFSKKLTRQLRKFAMTRKTATERWAAIHALMRAYGMTHDYNGPRDAGKLKHNRVALSAKYFILLPKLNWYCILCYGYIEAKYIVVVQKGITHHNAISGGGLHRVDFMNIKRGALYTSKSNLTCPQVLK